jgi:hypothetical protein
MRYALCKASSLLPAAAPMLGLAAVPAAADCAGSKAIDSCLVGAWKQTGGGAVEWMRRNMPPGMTIPPAGQSGQLVVLNKDGSFWTAPLTGNVTIRMEDPRGAMQAEGDIKVQAKGRWSAADSKFHLCTDEQKFEGQAQVKVPGADRHTMPLNPPPSTGPTTFGYKCAGDTLETRQAIPGVADPMTTQYARTAAK